MQGLTDESDDVAPLGCFVGRQAELAEITQRLRTVRLVTLTGVAGVGKTRLARQVASQTRHLYPHGVWVVEAASVQDGRLLAHMMTTALDLPRRSPCGPLADLAEFLRDRTLLLVVDNCEHVVEACAEVISTLLAAAPGLRVLATGRQALRIAGEQIWPIAPLATPDACAPPASADYPAVNLFGERASVVRPGFRVTVENWDAVASVCRQLDGLPLAIELAAARLSTMSLDALLVGLRDHDRLLSTESPALPARHRSLPAALDWSYNLCSPVEQLLWQRVSVFAGSFGLDTVEQVCVGDGVRAGDVFDAMMGLVDKSILVREPRFETVRYRLLGTVRQYGRDKLRASGQQPVLLRRHRDHYLRLAEQHAAEWFGPRQAAWCQRMRGEQPDIRSALEYSLATAEEARTGQWMAASLWCCWIGCGLLPEGRYWLNRALRVDQTVSRSRAKALWVNAWIAHIQGDTVAATAMAEQCLADAQRLRDSRTLAHATHVRGATALVSDDFTRAVSLLSHAKQLLGEELTTDPHDADVRSTRALADVQLAAALAFRGEADRAIALSKHSRDACAAAGEQWVRSYALSTLALAEWESGRTAEAAGHAREALRIKRTFYDLLGTALSVELLAWVAAADGACERAAMLLGGTDRIWSLFGPPLFGSHVRAAKRHASESRCRQELGEVSFESIWRRGRDLPIGEIIAVALA